MLCVSKPFPTTLRNTALHWICGFTLCQKRNRWLLQHYSRSSLRAVMSNGCELKEYDWQVPHLLMKGFRKWDYLLQRNQASIFKFVIIYIFMVFYIRKVTSGSLTRDNNAKMTKIASLQRLNGALLKVLCSLNSLLDSQWLEISSREILPARRIMSGSHIFLQLDYISLLKLQQSYKQLASFNETTLQYYFLP